MRAKKTSKKPSKSKKLSSSKLMFLSFILLFIIFEALYMLREQHKSVQSNSLEKSVAGVTIEK